MYIKCIYIYKYPCSATFLKFKKIGSRLFPNWNGINFPYNEPRNTLRNNHSLISGIYRLVDCNMHLRTSAMLNLNKIVTGIILMNILVQGIHKTFCIHFMRLY